MPTPRGTKKTCPNGHIFYKSSDCPVCPQCENERTSEFVILELISAPAKRALEGIGVDSIKELRKHSIKQLLALHGFGPKAIRIIQEYLGGNNMDLLK